MKMLSRKYIWLGILLTMIMVIGLIPAGFAEAVPNYGFIPNSGEASVSKVDLVTGEVVATYYTAPRLGDNGNLVPPYAWRTSRIAMDAEGNAWVLNVGADAYLSSYPANPPTNFSTYKTFVAASGLVGSVARIQADTTGLISATDATPLSFGTDEAVDVIPIGVVGGMPRAIAISTIDDSIWIGFYGEKTFRKYVYSESEGLEFQNTSFTANFTPYEAKFDDDGILWFSSRNANPTISALPGIWYFDTTKSEAVPTRIDLGVNPYSILIDNRESGTVVWATALDNRLFKIEGGIVTPYVISGASGLRGLSFDANGVIWMAGSSNHTVSWFDPSNNTSGTSGVIASGAVPVGIGMDESGMMWAVCRNDTSSTGFIAKFDPKNLAGGFTKVYVGFRPYAYGDFVVPPETYGFCGYKFFNDTELGLEGWTIELRDQAGALIATTITDADGKYCFSDLPAGTYTISESPQTGWLQVFPGGDGTHTITLPGDLENLVVNGDFELGDVETNSGYSLVTAISNTSGGDNGLGTLDYEGVYAVGTSPYLYHKLWSDFADHTENDINNLMMIVNGSIASPTVWTQTIDVDQNSEYTFSFWGASSYYLDTATIEVYINDIKIDTFVAPSGIGEWKGFSALWNSGTDTSAVIKLLCTTSEYNGNDFALDDFSMDKNFNFRNREREKVCFSETAWAYGGTEEENGAENDVARFNNLIDLNNSNAWGWTNKFDGEVATYPLWAAAGQNILDNGFQVGEVTVTKNGDCVTVVYNIFDLEEYEKYTITEAHLWVGSTPLPEVLSGGRVKVMIPTSAPGQFDKTVMFEEGSGIAEGGKSATFTICALDFTGEIWVAAHAVIDWCEFVE
jgi:hypothetical protein